MLSSLSSVLPTSQVFTSGYVNTETILHFFYKITYERGTKTMFTYAHVKWFYGQSEHAYYLNYFIIQYTTRQVVMKIMSNNTTLIQLYSTNTVPSFFLYSSYISWITALFRWASKSAFFFASSIGCCDRLYSARLLLLAIRVSRCTWILFTYMPNVINNNHVTAVNHKRLHSWMS